MYKFPVGDVKDVDVNRIVAENIDSDAIVLPSDGTGLCTVLVKRSFVARFNVEDNVMIGNTVLEHGVGKSRLHFCQNGRRHIIFCATDGNFGQPLPKGWVAIPAFTDDVQDQIVYAQNYKRRIWVSVELFDKSVKKVDQFYLDNLDCVVGP